MTAKDAHAREKSKAVEQRLGPLVGRTGTLEVKVAQKTDRAAVSHPPGKTCTNGFTGAGVNNGLPGATGVANDLNAISADIASLYTAVNALITALNA